jgi:hypothetical protein
LISVPGAPFPQARLQLFFAAKAEKMDFQLVLFQQECRSFHANQLV